MQDERWEAEMTESLRPLMPRAMPNARFVRDLDQEVRHAARQRMAELGIRPAIPFEEMVIELRRLVRLLCKTLVPVSPSVPYIQQTSMQLQKQAVSVYARPRTRPQLWLMVGGLVGSLLSLGGLVAAYVLRRRNNGRKDEE